jgi:hypothetical protein
MISRVAVLGAVLALFACGDDSGSNGGSVGIEPDQVLDFYGAQPGSCFLYSFPTGVGTTTGQAVVVVSEDDTQFPTRNSVRWELTNANGPDLVRIFEAAEQQLRLLFEQSGSGATQRARFFVSRQGDDPAGAEAPVFLSVIPATSGDPILADDTFRTTTTPALIQVGGEFVPGTDPEVYEFVVLGESEVSPVGSDRTFQAFNLSYRVTRDGAPTTTESYDLSEGFGLVRFEYLGSQFSLNDFFVVRSDGTSEGDLNCADFD